MTYNPNWIPFRSEKECRELAELCAPDQMEWERRTGRTTRTLKQAFDAAQDTEAQVFLVVSSCTEVNWFRDMFKMFGAKPKNLHIVNIVPGREFEDALKLKTAGRRNLRVFFDHYFWERMSLYYSRQFSGK